MRVNGMKNDELLDLVNEKDAAIVFIGRDNLVGVEFLDQMKFCLDLREYKVELT